MSFTLWNTFSKMSFPFVVNLMSNTSSVRHKLESTPRMKMVRCAVSVVSVLSSTAREYATKSFPLSVDCVFKSVAISQTRSATIFLLRLTFANACFLSGHHHHLDIIHLFRNSPSVNGWTDLAISSTTIKLAFTVASLWFHFGEKCLLWCQIPLQLLYLL